MASVLSLRPVYDSDSQLLWEWANDPLVRHQSFSSDSIAWEDHVKWFSQKLKDPNCHQFIGVDEAGDPVGQVRFDLNHEAEVSVSTSAAHRGKGHASSLLSLASAELIRSTGVTRINAHIRPENVASQRAFEKAGYRLVGEIVFKGHSAVEMDMVGVQS